MLDPASQTRLKTSLLLSISSAGGVGGAEGGEGVGGGGGGREGGGAERGRIYEKETQAFNVTHQRVRQPLSVPAGWFLASKRGRVKR